MGQKDESSRSETPTIPLPASVIWNLDKLQEVEASGSGFGFMLYKGLGLKV